MPKVSAHDAAIYAANDLIMALTKPQPTNSFISIGDDQLVALQQLATIFQTSITKKPISDLGVPDIAPPQRPCTRSQTKKLANAALTAPQHTMLFHTQPQPTVDQKQEEDLVPDPPLRHPALQQTTHHPNYSQFTPTISHKTRGTPGRSVPPHPISKLSHGPRHRQATRVQTTHQSPRQQTMPNVATLKCK